MNLRPFAPLVAATALGACAGGLIGAHPQTSAHATLVAQGRAIAEANCRTCHAIGTSGGSPFAPAPPFRTLAERYPINMLDEAFAEGILVGHPAMPEFRLEPPQIEALEAYLESIQERGGD